MIISKRIMKHRSYEEKFLTTALMAGAVALSALTFSSCSGSDNLAEQVDMIPVKIEKGDTWSMVNKKGEVIYEDEFEHQPCYVVNGYFAVEEGEGYTLYKADDKKPVAVKGCEELKSVGVMVDGVVPVVKPDERIKFVDGDGDVKGELGPVGGIEIVECAPIMHDGLFQVADADGKWGYANAKGEVVIRPQYNGSNSFNEGLAVVRVNTAKEGEPSEYQSLVIDKKGETVFKVKKDYEEISGFFYKGYMSAKNADDKCVLIDKKGEIKRLPAKVKEVEGWSDNFVIFRDQERNYGVMDFEGEIKIRAKYENIVYVEAKDQFLCRKEKGEYVWLDLNGEEKGREEDYDMMVPLAGFGIFAGSEHDIQLLDWDGKPLGRNEFYDLGGRYSLCSTLKSDYFDFGGVATKIADLVSDNGIGKFAFGKPVSKYFANPGDVDGSYDTFRDSDLDISGYGYSSYIQVFTNDYFKNYDWPTGYVWNDNALINHYDIHVSTSKSIKDSDINDLADMLQKKGFKLVGQTTNNGILYTLLDKGNTAVLITFNNDFPQGLNVLGFDKNLSADKLQLYIDSNNIPTAGMKAAVPSATPIPAADSVPADTVPADSVFVE